MGAPVLAQSDLSPDATVLSAAMEQMGCSISPGPQEMEARRLSGLDGEQIAAAAQELFSAGLLQLQGEALVVVTGSCLETAGLPDAPETMIATLTGLRDTGCVLHEDEANAFIEARGPREVIVGHLRDLEVVNLVRRVGSLPGLLLDQRACGAEDGVIASFAAQVPDILELPEVNRMPFTAEAVSTRVLYVEWLASQEGCALPASESFDGMAELGADNTLEFVVVPLLDAGILPSDSGSITRLSDEMCAAGRDERRAAVEATR
ncbi:hypothetical protein HKCCE4037_14735 [Rhodobacterales bacterium HKCCE4037]|nr:hypothetical protein [Rhodobacterales bacterium HKCCE4037]